MFHRSLPVSVFLFICLFGYACVSAAPPEVEAEVVGVEARAGVDSNQAIPERKASETTQFEGFVVAGSQRHIRSSIASIAEELRSELASLTGEKDREMQLPIIIQLYGEEGDAAPKRSVVSQIQQVHGRYQLKIHIHLAKGVDHKMLKYRLMEMILYERGLGDGQSVPDGERVLVKPWLIVGLLEALDLKRGRADRKIYQAELPYFQILPLQNVFDTTETEWAGFDGYRPMVFKAISGGMVNALLRQPDGRRSMGAYLANVATFKGEEENLMRKHFPSMNKSRNSLGKWVDLEMAELGTAEITHVLSILETEKHLENALVLRFRGDEKAAVSVGIDEYSQVVSLEAEERIDAVAGARSELERLSFRCFPNFRPLIREYEVVLGEIAQGKDESIQQRLNQLEDVRMKLQEAGVRARDYLDWFYITRANEVSVGFEEFRELSNALDAELLKVRPDDSTDAYLNSIQQIYGSTR